MSIITLNRATFQMFKMIIQHLFIKTIFYRMMVYQVLLKGPWFALAKHLMFKIACSVLLLLLLL